MGRQWTLKMGPISSSGERLHVVAAVVDALDHIRERARTRALATGPCQNSPNSRASRTRRVMNALGRHSRPGPPQACKG